MKSDFEEVDKLRKSKKRFLIDPAVILAAGMAATVFAMEPVYGAPAHQGRLADPFGNPVPNSTYQFIYEVYTDSMGGDRLWADTHMVNTNQGMFTVQLRDDMKNAFLPSEFDSGDFERWLQVYVEGEMLQPRTELGNVPYAYASTRQWGDIFTAPGNLILPISDGSPAIEMSADGASSSIKMIDPGDDELGFDVFIGGEGNSIKLMDPGDDENSMIEMNGVVGGEANFRMFNPQPEPPAVIMEMSSTPSIAASFKMFNPQPEPPAGPLLEMSTDPFGAVLSMTAPQMAGPGDEITDPLFEVKVDSTGGAINLYDDVGKYMGTEPSPFTPGGSFYMKDPSTEITNVWIDSEGLLSTRKGIFGYDIVNNGNYNLALGSNHSITGGWCFAGGSYAQINHNDCFVWSDYSTTTPLASSSNNQFLVRSTGGIAFYTNAAMDYGVSLGPGDYAWNSVVPPLTARNSRDVDGADILYKIEQLPLKRFSAGGETEHISPSPEDFNRLFDLNANENQISVPDQSGIALAGIKEMINIINELRDKNAELERRIAELERTR